jgi:hypothetical protein
LARAGGKYGPIGTRTNKSKECKDQRPVGPEELKTRFFVAEFGTKEELLSYVAAE